MDNDQDNANPFADADANVRSAACGAVAAHNNGSANNLNKRSRGPQMSDVIKIKSLYTPVDALEAPFAITDDVGQSISSTNNRGNASILLHIDALQFVSPTGRQHLNIIQASMNNTSAKSRAALAQQIV